MCAHLMMPDSATVFSRTKSKAQDLLDRGDLLGRLAEKLANESVSVSPNNSRKPYQAE